MQELARFGLDHGVPIAHDNAYAELTYDGYVAPSFLASPDGVEAGIEIYSLSKSLNMPGWRVAFALGNAAMLQNLTRLKTNVDSGMFLALQRTAIAALDLVGPFSAGMREIYRRRRDLVCAALAAHRRRRRAAARRHLRVGADAARGALGGLRRAPAGRAAGWSWAPDRRTASSARATCACR